MKRNQDYLSDYYGKSIYNFSPIVGINGTGKSTILDFILRHNSNTKSAIDNVKMVSIYTDDEKIFIDSISMEISNEKDFEKYNNRQNIKIKNCSTKKIREGSGGSYGGGAIAYYEYDADHFPNYFLTFDELRKSKVIHSKNMLVQLSALLYRFEEKFPEHANESLIDKIFINYLFNIFDTGKLLYNTETSDRLKSGDITYYDFLAQWKSAVESSDVESSDVESIEDYNIFISNFMEFIDLVHALEKDDIVQIKENVILISYSHRFSLTILETPQKSEQKRPKIGQSNYEFSRQETSTPQRCFFSCLSLADKPIIPKKATFALVGCNVT
ncbi:TPA: hypothetical protein U0643_000710 [Streptococcus suis]|nr:hypothetical protein [Streptococcus suis]HEM2849311.1 hypothetical protein [Streptococcus suis]